LNTNQTKQSPVHKQPRHIYFKMKASIISALFFGAAIAAPANIEKRSVVIVEQIVTQWTTVTVYNGHKPTGTASRAAFFEFPSSVLSALTAPTSSSVPSSAPSSAPAPAPAPTQAPVVAAVVVPSPAPVAPAPVAPAPAAAAPATGGGPSGTGEITFYTLGTVSCGQTYSDSDAVVALSTDVMVQYQGANPNANTLCNKPITITLNGKTVTGKVVDTCMGCAPGNIDLSPSLFNQLADPSAGRVGGVTWSVGA
jgi:hypothetical protein